MTRLTLATVDPATGKVRADQLPDAPTKRVTASLFAGGGVHQQPSGQRDAANRGIVKLPVTTVRWRARIRNYSALENEAGVGRLFCTGVWVGEPTGFAGGPAGGRWEGLFASAPEAALALTNPGTINEANPGVELPVNATADWISDWVDDPDLQFAHDVAYGLSVGLHTNGTNTVVWNDYVAGTFYSTAGPNGQGAASEAGIAGAPKAAAHSPGSVWNGDVRIEYEFVGDEPVLLAVGDSITSGYTSTPDTGLYDHETWPGAVGMRDRVPWINLGVGSTRTDHWVAGTDWKWTRADLETTVPDVAIVALGTNDVNNIGGISNTAAEIIANLVAIIEHLRALGIPRVFLTTIPPGNFTAPEEAVRAPVNAWIRNLPVGVDGFFDFDKALRIAATPEVVDANYIDGSYPHFTPAANQQMASFVRI